MADLEELPLEFPDGIRQHEQEDVVLGGPPDLAGGRGLDNVPLQQLAKRTRWLFKHVGDLLGYFSAGKIKASSLPAIDAARLDGKAASVFALAGHTHDSRYLQKTGGGVTGDIAMNQKRITNVRRIDFGLGDSIGYDTTNGLEIFENDNLVARIGPRSFVPANFAIDGHSPWHDGRAAQTLSTSGYQRLPTGLILQWGRAFGVSTGDLISFPITFPSELFQIFPADPTANSVDGIHSIGTRVATRSNVRFSVADNAGRPATSDVSYWAIGR